MAASLHCWHLWLEISSSISWHRSLLPLSCHADMECDEPTCRCVWSWVATRRCWWVWESLLWGGMAPTMIGTRRQRTGNALSVVALNSIRQIAPRRSCVSMVLGCISHLVTMPLLHRHRREGEGVWEASCRVRSSNRWPSCRSWAESDSCGSASTWTS